MAEKEEKLQFLGLGSVVEIEHMDALTDTLYFIVARAVGKDSSGQTILRYQVAPHPEGATKKHEDKIITLSEGDISKTIFEGYCDEKDDIFLSEMLEGMEQAIKKMKTSSNHSTIPLKKVEEVPATPVPQIEDESELLKKDPFYKFKA